MSKALVRSPVIDPEFAAEYEKAQTESVRRVADPSPNTSHQSSEAAAPGGSPDPLLELKAIAERQQREGINRKQFADGSFDQVENDLTNTLKIGWDFLTRP